MAGVLSRGATLCAMCLLIFPGCSCVMKGKKIPTQHIVMVNAHGALVDPTGNMNCPENDKERIYPCNGKHSVFKYYPALSINYREQYLDELFASLKEYEKGLPKCKPVRILIYVHGGLNMAYKAVRRAAEHTEKVREDSDFYPVYINWRSSLRSSYYQHLTKKRQGRNLPWSPRGWAMSPFYFVTDVGRSVIRAPIVWVNQVTSDAESLSYTNKYKVSEQDVTELQRQVGPCTALRLGGFRKGGDNRRKREQFSYLSSYIVTFPLKLFSSMFIDAMGTSSWEAMLRRTETGFHREPPGSPPHTIPRKPRLHGDVARFLIELKSEIASSDREYRITLVGHSMGAIIINRIINEYPDLPIKNIVYMAAACSIKDYEENVYPFLKNNPDAKMYHLALHRQADVRERTTALGFLDIPPRGSLLVWIDNYLGAAHTERDLTVGRIANLSQALLSRTRWAEVYPQIYVREFSVGHAHKRFEPQKHGDFSRWHYWKEACWDPYVDPAVLCYSGKRER